MPRRVRARTAAQLEADLATVEDCLRRGLSARAAAQVLGRPHATVERDAQHVITRWQKELLVKVAEVKARELAKLDRIEEACWAAVDRALEPRTKKHTKVKSVGPAQAAPRRLTPIETEVASTVVEGLVPPSYLEGIRRCIELRARIYGFDRPTGAGDMPDLRPFFDALAGVLPETWDAEAEDEAD